MDGWQEALGEGFVTVSQVEEGFFLGLRLQEVVWCLTSHMRFPTPWSWVKLQEGILEGVVKLHDGSLVSTAVAVVGGGEDGDHVPVVGPVVPLHHQLMGPGQDRLSTGNTSVQKVKVSAGINDSIANS